jgi:hypothetical protein
MPVFHLEMCRLTELRASPLRLMDEIIDQLGLAI